MAKMFITSGEGNQQTLSDIQNEKIPIYDSQQDAESDLANLAEGQIVGTKEGKFDVDDMKQYIRNQNVLSDYESKNISDDSNNPTIMDYDGFVCLTNQDGNSGYGGFMVNGVKWSTGGRGQGWATATIPVKKGDSIYRVSDSWSSSNIYYCRFYKLRDYSDR